MSVYKGDYTVRGKDLRQLARLLKGPADIGDLYGAARTLVGWAEPQQTQLPPVSVASVAFPLDEPVNVPADPDAGDCDRCDDSPTGRPEGWVAGWVAAMRFAHHAHAPEPGERFMSANGVLGAGPDAVIVDGDWLNANLADPDVEPQPYDMPSPEADALDRIAEAYLADQSGDKALSEIDAILRETGRLP